MVDPLRLLTSLLSFHSLSVGHIPIVTTILSALFGGIIFRRYMRKPGTFHHLWWALGVLVYGVGTLTESITTVFGWREPIFRLWYISGALLGGAPLAQGSVYYHLPRRTAHILAFCLVTYVAIASFYVWTTPIQVNLVEPYRLTGRVFAVQSVRLFSPLVNLYALVFLVGGALFSAFKYWKTHEDYARFIGNLLIAAGALLPAIGGSFARFGYTEVLYLFEFFGILLIWRGYVLCTLHDDLTQGNTDRGVS